MRHAVAARQLMLACILRMQNHYTILPPKSKAVIEIFAGNMYTVFTCIVKELPFRNFCQLVENGGKTMDFIDLLMEEWNKCCGYFSE